MQQIITKFAWFNYVSDFYMIEAMPENLIGDRAYDSDPLDEELHRDGIEMIAPHPVGDGKSGLQELSRLPRRALRAGMRRWRNGLAVASVIWWHDRPFRAFPRMRSDARGRASQRKLASLSFDAA